MQTPPLPVIKICRVPKIFFETLEKERLKEMREGVVNFLHAMDTPITINLLKGRSGGLIYFIALPRKLQDLSASVVAQFKRWEIIGEQGEISPREMFGPEDMTGVVLTFIARQYFWDRMKYTQVQVPNFFEALVSSQKTAWVQLIINPVSEKRVKRPLDNLYRRELKRLGRKERHGRLYGGKKDRYTVLSTHHQELMSLARDETLFTLTFRVAISCPPTFQTKESLPRWHTYLKTIFSKEQRAIFSQHRHKFTEFYREMLNFGNLLFAGLPGKVYAKISRLEKLWGGFTKGKSPRSPRRHIFLGNKEVGWVFPWPRNNFCRWEFLSEKVTDLAGGPEAESFTEGPLAERPLAERPASLLLGYQATKAAESGVTEFPLKCPLDTSLGIFGFPGTGKTNAVNILLQQLAIGGQNVLYVNGVKDEDHLAALAPERAKIWRPSQLGFDPFEHVPGVPMMRMIMDFVEGFTYTKNLLVALENLMKIAFMKYAIRQGWGPTPESLNEDAGAGQPIDLATFPNLVQTEVRRSKYSGEVRGNLEGATNTRVWGFLYSPLGQIFTKNAKVPVAEFTQGVNLLFLRALHEDDQCFVLWILLKKIFQHMVSQKDRGHKDTLFLVLEEAHVFLKQTYEHEESEFGKARAMLAEFFASLIKEGREYGIRILLVDQQPSDLIRSAIQPLANTVIFRVGKRDAEIFHQDPRILESIDKLPNFFAIFKGKTVPHEVLLRPPKYHDAPEGQVSGAKKRAQQNTQALIAQYRAGNPNTQPVVPTENFGAKESPTNPAAGESWGGNIPGISGISPSTNLSPSEGDAFNPSEENNNPKPELSQKELMERVFEYLINHPSKRGVPIQEIETGCDIDHAQLIDILRSLREEGSICEVRHRTFAIA